MLQYTCHSLVYPVIHQQYFESIFSYLWGSLGCLNLNGCTSQTHCMGFWSRNLINRCSDSDLRKWVCKGISQGCSQIYCVYTGIWSGHILSTTSFTLNQALSSLRRRRFSAARSWAFWCSVNSAFICNWKPIFRPWC